MAQWFKYRSRVRQMMATLGVTACVATGMVFAQYGSSDSLSWRAPAIHGRQVNQTQQVPQSQPNSQQYQLVQHLEPTPTLLPPVDMIDNNQVSQPQPIHGTRVAQAPGLTDAQRDTMYSERGRPGSANNPMTPGAVVPAPANTYPAMGDRNSNGIDTSLTAPVPGREKMVPCGDPRDVGGPMTDVNVLIDIDIKWDNLNPCPINVADYEPRQWPMTCFTYNASLACVSGAYFEHVQVERYGHSWGPFLQPVMSAAHFYGSVLFLPYKMGLTPPSECVYTVGYYRPGSCAPYMIDPVPLSLRAGVAQAGAVVGLAYALP